MLDLAKYTSENLKSQVPEIFQIAARARDADELRELLWDYAHRMQFETFDDYDELSEGSILRVRDSATRLSRMLTRRSEDKAKFSLAKAIHDIALDRPRPDLTPAFYAELLYLLLGLQGRGPGRKPVDWYLSPSMATGREAAAERSDQLDKLSEGIQEYAEKHSSGLAPEIVRLRAERKDHILSQLGATDDDWSDWKWQVANIQRKANHLGSLVQLTLQEKECIEAARKFHLPFGVTPYYLSLMTDDPGDTRDRGIRAQVIPPPSYTSEMALYDEQERECLDFMGESDTSPIDLITRRYPGICIFKPFNTCPQICVYCQRNWEIKDAMQAGAMASDDKIDSALEWIAKHPAVREVLLTGGDPLAMSDEQVKRVMDGISSIDSVERIRVGTRTFATMPMRITDSLADLLASYRKPGKLQISVVTHVQHLFEITPELVAAVQKLRDRKLTVYNQLVYTFYVSRRFEAAMLRRNLQLAGIEPYYTFNTKGKDETSAYRVPLARLLQEQAEEARLLPGLERTDEAVYNVPRLGKNYLRARQHRDLVSILPNGARLYEFHPWEKNISGMTSTYVSEDVPILEYLLRLDAVGEDVSYYETIWYYL